MLRAIAFDLWETVIANTPAASRGQERLRLERMAAILGKSAEEIAHSHRQVWLRCQELYWSRDQDVPCRRQVEHFLETLGVDADEPTLAALEDAYAMVATEVLPSLVDGAAEVVTTLKARGY